MSYREVTTQGEFNQALAHGVDEIDIRSVAGVWITVTATGSATVRATGSSTVRATGSATVRAYGSSTVRAYDSATVRAYGSATVRAYDSATVRAYDSSTVTATGSATVRAYDSATVRATPFVAVHLFSALATVEGGHVIDVSARCDSAEEWLEYHGVTISSGTAVLYKAVGDSWTTSRGREWTYAPGATVIAQDYDDSRVCGGGLHLCSTPAASARYLYDATRYVACEVDVDTLIPLDDKCKVREARVLHEVDIDGYRIGGGHEPAIHQGYEGKSLPLLLPGGQS